MTAKGRLLIVAAAILWSTSALFVKSPAFEDWPASTRGLVLAFYRALFASLLLAFWVRRISWDWRLLVAGLTFAVMNVSYLSAMVFIEASLTIWLQYTAPFWVLLGSWFFLRECPQRHQWPGWIVLALGVLVVLGTCDWSGSLWGVALGLLSGIGFAGVVLTLRWMTDLDGAWVVLVNHALTAILLAPLVLLIGLWPTSQQWGLLATFGMLQMGLPYVLFAIGIRYVQGPQASALLLLEPVFLPAWVWLAYHHLPDYQLPHWGTLLGGALILLGLFIQQGSRAATIPAEAESPNS